MAKLEILQADYKTLSRTVILRESGGDFFIWLGMFMLLFPYRYNVSLWWSERFIQVKLSFHYSEAIVLP